VELVLSTTKFLMELEISFYKSLTFANYVLYFVMQKLMIAKASCVLAKLIDPYIVLGMTCFLPLLESTDNLIHFAPKHDVYISNFVATQQFCQGHLFNLYLNIDHAFATKKFWSFKKLLDCSHEQIFMK